MAAAADMLDAGRAELRSYPPDHDEIGAVVRPGSEDRWLVAGDRGERDPFGENDRALLDAMAAIAAVAAQGDCARRSNDLIRGALDAACRIARTGSATVELAASSVGSASERLELEAELRRAIEHGELVVHADAVSGGGRVGSPPDCVAPVGLRPASQRLCSLSWTVDRPAVTVPVGAPIPFARRIRLLSRRWVLCVRP